MSESEAAGKLIRMPGIVEAEATIPNRSLGVPKLVAKGLRTGFFDIVELRIAKKPKAHITRKKAFCVRALPSIFLALKSSLDQEYFSFAIEERMFLLGQTAFL